MRALFLCAYTKGIAYYAEKVVAINREYCKRHGYGLECETDSEKIVTGCEGRSTFWYYFKMLKEHFGRPDVDWFVKVDCDAFCVNHDRDLECWFGSGADIIWASDHGPDVMNGGIQLIRNNETNRRFYQQVWDAAERVNRGAWKTGCWHEQSMLSSAYCLKGDNGPQIKVVPNACRDSFDCFDEHLMGQCIIYHDITKKLIPRLVWRPGTRSYALAAEVVKAEPVAVKDAPIAVVYYAYLVNDWKALVTEQLAHLQTAGLYAAAKEVWLMTCGPKEAGEEFAKLFTAPKFHHEHTTQNLFEYPGIAKVKELAETGDWKILYFHTKGISHLTKNMPAKQVASQCGWRKYLEHFTIEKWREAVEKLEEYDMVVPYYHHHLHHPPGNFWWATSAHLKTCEPPAAVDRWYFEYWASTKGKNPKVYEGKHLGFNPYASDWPAWLYDGSRDLTGLEFEIVEALYGSAGVLLEADWTLPASHEHAADMKSLLQSLLARNNGRKIHINVGNESMGGDPHFGAPKHLKLWWTLKGVEGEPVYHTDGIENWDLTLEL